MAKRIRWEELKISLIQAQKVVAIFEESKGEDEELDDIAAAFRNAIRVYREGEGISIIIDRDET